MQMSTRQSKTRKGPKAFCGLAAIVLLCLGSAAMAGTALADDEAAESPPPSADPHDLNGTWFGTGYYDHTNFMFRPADGSAPPFSATGAAVFAARMAADKAGNPIPHPEAQCAPWQFPGAENGAPFLVMQTPGLITFIAETNHDARVVRMNVPHPSHIVPTFRGDSVAHWEGDTLVIDTLGYRGDMWLDSKGTPASRDLHVIERIKKTKGGRVLDNMITLIDPTNYTKPWTVHRIFLWRPHERVHEEICEEGSDIVEPGNALKAPQPQGAAAPANGPAS
jgi:hypothetical protein